MFAWTNNVLISCICDFLSFCVYIYPIICPVLFTLSLYYDWFFMTNNYSNDMIITIVDSFFYNTIYIIITKNYLYSMINDYNEYFCDQVY